MKRQVIRSLEDLATLEWMLVASAKHTSLRVRQVLENPNDLDALAELRFAAIGCDPLDPGRPLNLVEQMNQSFTYLASVEAVRWLLERHPDSAPYFLNLGTSSGSDICQQTGPLPRKRLQRLIQNRMTSFTRI